MATQETRTRIVWDYAPAPESPDHVRLRDSYGLFIDGDFRDPLDGTRVSSINPATEATRRGGLRRAAGPAPRGRVGPRRATRAGRG